MLPRLAYILHFVFCFFAHKQWMTDLATQNLLLTLLTTSERWPTSGQRSWASSSEAEAVALEAAAAAVLAAGQQPDVWLIC